MKRFLALLLAALLGFTQQALAISNPVNLGKNTDTASLTNVMTTVTNDCPVGSLVVMLAGYLTIADTLSSVSDNSTGGPNSWTVVDNTTRTGLGLGIGYANVTHDIAVGSTITATFSGSTISTINAACVVSGIAASSPLDVHNNTSNGTTSPATSVSTGTLSQASEILFGALSCASASNCGVFTAGGSFTNASVANSSNPSGLLAYQVVSSTAAVSWAPSWANTSTAYVSDVISFKGAATGGASQMLTGVGQ